MADMNDMPDMADTYHHARRIQLWKQEAMHCRAVFENKISKLYGECTLENVERFNFAFEGPMKAPMDGLTYS